MSAQRLRLKGFVGVSAAFMVALALVAPSAGAQQRPGQLPEPPRLMPGDVRVAGVTASPSRWLVGARSDPVSDQIARRSGAHRLMPGTSVYSVPRSRARMLIRRLNGRGRYVFSEPDRISVRRGFPSDPGSSAQWGLGAIGATALTPPPVEPDSPLLAVIESGFDPSHADAQGMQFSGAPDPSFDGSLVSHGTAVASVAGAPANGVGITGVWPGMRTLVVTSGTSCSSTVQALYRAAQAGARVINMSYGFSGRGCFAHYIATQRLYGDGKVLVAAAGNEFELGNPEDGRPAADPHVITVAAVDSALQSAAFSNENYAVDLSAPGVGVVGAVPPALDTDGIQDGYEALDGTSFSAPMVAAGTAWVAQERPGLDQTQLTDLIRTATVDLGRRGYDTRYGFGLFDLPRALSNRALGPDYLEPNDDIGWVNGRYFSRSDPSIYNGRTSAFSARIDRIEDPFDVYRVVLKGRRTVRLTALPRHGNVVLEAYNPYAKTVSSRRGRFAVSDRPGERREMVYIRNPYRGRITVYAVLWSRTLEARYRLQLHPRR